MGFLTEDQKVKIDPRVLYGADYLKGLLGEGTPSVPKQGTAGLSPVQQLILSQLPGLLQTSGEAGQTAGDYYRGILSDEYNVLEDPRYEALRQESERLTRAGQTSLRRGAERYGQLDSTPAKVAESELLARSGSELLKNLGALLTNREQQKMQAASGIQAGAGTQIGQTGQVLNIADIERAVEQQRADALYQQAIMQILFPYQYQTGLAEALMNMPGGVITSGGGLKDWAEAAGFFSPLISENVGAMNLGGGGGGGIQYGGNYGSSGGMGAAKTAALFAGGL